MCVFYLSFRDRLTVGLVDTHCQRLPDVFNPTNVRSPTSGVTCRTSQVIDVAPDSFHIPSSHVKGPKLRVDTRRHRDISVVTEGTVDGKVLRGLPETNEPKT